MTPKSAPFFPGALSRRALLQRSGYGVIGLSALPFLGRGIELHAADAPPGDAGARYATDPVWLKAKYGPWGGPGVRPLPGPMDDVRVRDYAPLPSLVLPEHQVAKARFPAVDIH